MYVCMYVCIVVMLKDGFTHETIHPLGLGLLYIILLIHMISLIQLMPCARLLVGLGLNI